MIQVLTENVEGFISGFIGLVASYYLRYTFPDRVSLIRAGSAIRTIYSPSESISKLVEVSYSPILREMHDNSSFHLLLLFLRDDCCSLSLFNEVGWTLIGPPFTVGTGIRAWAWWWCELILIVSFIILGTILHLAPLLSTTLYRIEAKPYLWSLASFLHSGKVLCLSQTMDFIFEDEVILSRMPYTPVIVTVFGIFYVPHSLWPFLFR